MTRIIAFGVIALLLAGGATFAQQPTPPAPMQPPAHQMPMPGGMCPMMGGMMSGGEMMGGMMQMMGGQTESSRMMQMRGEMMKAMGDVLIKYGKMMEPPPPAR